MEEDRCVDCIRLGLQATSQCECCNMDTLHVELKGFTIIGKCSRCGLSFAGVVLWRPVKLMTYVTGF